MEDILEIKTNFFIGNFQSVINEGEGSMNPEKRLFVYRSHIALQNYSYVLDEVRVFFSFLSSTQSSRIR
jgi:hypothetical protein